MDFVERLFGISPDGGDGTLELLLIALPLVVAAFLRRKRARQQLEPRDPIASPEEQRPAVK